MRWLLAPLLLAAVTPAAAHDFWVRPSSFAVEPGEVLDVRLYVGDGTAIDELGRDPDLVQRFETIQGGARRTIGGPPHGAPAGRARVGGAGVAVLVYQSRHSFVELPADKFESYLDDEGLEEISFERQRRGESLAPSRESYARYCKSLVRVGDSRERGRDVAVGMPIELIAEGDPFAWHDGDEIAFRLVFDDQPLPGRLVKLTHLDDHGLRLRARSDMDGRVVFTPPRGGPWRVVAVHMLPARAGVAGEWESFWASLTFSLQE
jgi:uncharacterized GH25 family protein